MTLSTERLDLRAPVEADRRRFVALFGDEVFMTYSGGVLGDEAANTRFDEMLVRANESPIAKRPIIERSTGTVLGYIGVNRFEFEDETRWEFGYRLIPSARGKGYATEAGTALLASAAADVGELLAMIDPRNTPSQNVADKLGFVFWKEAVVHGYLDRIYRWSAS